MKVIICGSSGLLGRDLIHKMELNYINCVGTYNNNFMENLVKINFNKINDIKENFLNIKPTICINLIVERQLEICESNWNLIKNTNIDIANNIAIVCKELNIHLIHISTDYVFDGKNAPYYPNNEQNPLQNYGISKLISEKKVMSHCSKYTIIRVPVLYSDNIQNFSENAVTLIGKKILNRIEVTKEDNFSIRRPNYIPDFCEFIIDIINNPIYGIIHYCNPYDKVTKYEISNIISKYLCKKNNIMPINEEPTDGVERPKDTLLKDDRINIYKYNFTSLKNGLEKCFSKIYHPPLLDNSNEVKDIFFLIDLDGTLINSDDCHYRAYKKTLEFFFNYNFTYEHFLELIHENKIDNFLIENFGIDNIQKIKDDKNNNIKLEEHIDLMPNSDKLINFIDKYKINHVVVTNTSVPVVKIFKEKQPILQKLKNWITRENYEKPKPNKECYQIAKNKYYTNEKYIIGIENTYSGLLALKEITKCIYIVTEINKNDFTKIKKEDVYLINDFDQIF